MNAELLTSGDERTFALVLDVGEEAVSSIQAWARREQVTAARVTGIGGFRSAELGYFDWETKEYQPTKIDRQAEVVSLLGDIAVGQEGPTLHAHVLVSLPDATTRGGHLLHGVVRPTLEVVITDAPRQLRRRSDPDTGLALLELSRPGGEELRT